LTKCKKLLILLFIRMLFCIRHKSKKPADVAELADAQASGACSLMGVEVRLLSSALVGKELMVVHQDQLIFF
jgi:hypothetical protein